MVSCVAHNCHNGEKAAKDGITFHRFPKNEEIKAKWVAAVSRKDWAPSPFSVLCSEHFQSSDYEFSPFLKKLKPGTIPSLFPQSPTHLQPKIEMPPESPTRIVEEIKPQSNLRLSKSQLIAELDKKNLELASKNVELERVKAKLKRVKVELKEKSVIIKKKTDAINMLRRRIILLQTRVGTMEHILKELE